MKIILFLLVGCSIAAAQSNIREFDDCGALQAVMFNTPDVVRIRCDTVYLLNSMTFRRYESAYSDLKKKGTSIANLMSSYDEIIGLQQRRIEEQSRQYDELHRSFVSLSTEADTMASTASSKLSGALGTLDGLNRDLTETKRLLEETRDIIEREQRGFNLDKLLWGIGGAAAGIIAGVLISR